MTLITPAEPVTAPKNLIAPKNLPTYKNLHHAIWLASCTLLMGGCQTTMTQNNATNSADANKTMRGSSILDSNYRDKITANTQAYKTLFDESVNPSADGQARLRLLKSINQHLTHNHVSVSQFNHHAAPYIKDGSVDALSDSLLRTLFNTFAKGLDEKGSSEEDGYDEEESYEPAFRDEDEYLQDPKALYLNYSDELANRLPEVGYSITRQTGMSEDFVETTDRAIEYVDTIDDCLVDYSYELDELISDNPKLTANDAKIKPFKKAYGECLAQSQKSYVDTIKAATGYQRQYINNQLSCVKQYDNRLADLLNSSRTPKQVDYDHYDSIYQSYDVCYMAVSQRYQMEPSYYTYMELSKKQLDYKNERVDCASKLSEQQQALAYKSITYRNNPKAYADLYYDFESCDADAYNHAYYPTEVNESGHDDSDYDSNDSDTDNHDASYTSHYLDNVSDEGNGEEEEVAVAAGYQEEGYEDDSSDAESDDEESNDDADISYSGVVHKLLNWFKRTPEQITAANLYNYQYLTFNSISQYEADNKRISSVYSYDFASPTMLSSMQLPIALDFNQAQITIDPSAIMPIVAVINPEHAPIPSEMSSPTVTFDMPEMMTSQLPPAVVYDVFIDSIQKSMTELDSSYFTAQDIRDDSFARQVGAARAVKVSFGSKQTGEFVGALIKHMGESLKTYVDEHPEQIPEGSALKASIEKWQASNEHYQTKDAGSILQLIEAIGPISFNKINYYYLDANDRLIAKQVRTMVGGNLTGAKSTFLAQTRYDLASFNQHPLAPLFLESFGRGAQPPMDGNVWVEQIQNRRAKLDQARYARYDYERENDIKEAEEAIQVAADQYNDGYNNDKEDNADNNIEAMVEENVPTSIDSMGPSKHKTIEITETKRMVPKTED
ncbi:MAG: hypothetical protein Q4P13_05085 [Psychrobacter sp.]|nr:hypothetical protein [Psychrobacter sp.]